MFKKTNPFAFLLGIFLLSLLFRIYELSNLPFYIHHDEVINTYVGRFILQNGMDLYGNLWPIFYFDKFGDFPPVLPMYLSGLATFVFGVNSFAVRFPGAIMGAILVFPVYFLVKQLFKDAKLALIAAFFTAIIPWTVVLSRASSEAGIGFSVFVSGLALLFYGLNVKNKAAILGSAVILFLSYLFYPSFRILTPLVLLPLPFLYDKKLRPILLAIFALSILFTGLIATTDWGRGRFDQTSIFSSPDIALKIEALATDEGSNNVILARIFHNKPLIYIEEFTSQYLSYFSPQFLVISGGLPFEQVVPDTGVIYFTFLILFFSLVFLNDKFRTKLYYYMWFLLLIAPIPAALTRDFVPNVYRSIFMVIPLVILASLGFLNIINLAKRNSLKIVVIGVLIFLITLEFVVFWHQYSSHTASYKTIFRGAGRIDVVNYVFDNKDDFEKIFLPSSGNLAIYYLFVREDFGKKYAQEFKTGLKIDSIENLEFLGDECPSEILKTKDIPENSVVIDYGNCSVPESFVETASIGARDSTVSHRILQKVRANP